MHRTTIVLSLATILTSALPAFAGPNGGSPSFFPVRAHRGQTTRTPAPHALLGDADQARSVRALPPGITGKHPTQSWQRRPSEGR